MASSDLGIRIFLSDEASAGFNALGLNLGRLSGLVGRAAGNFTKLNPAMQTAAVVAGGAGLAFGLFMSAIGFTVAQASALQNAMVTVQTQVQGATAAIGPLTATVIKLADSSQYTAQQVADGFAQLGAHGITAADILNTSIGQATINLAEAMGENGTTGAASLLSQTLEEFNAPASDATVYADVLIQTFKNGIPSIASLTQAFQQSSYIAAQLGIPVQALSRYLDVLAQSLGTGSNAGVTMHDMLQSLVSPTTGAADALGQLGLLTVNQTSPALQTLLERLSGVNKTAATVADNFQPTIQSLQAVYNAAKRYNLIPVGATFYSWATSIGLVTNSLEGANGQFLGLDNMVKMFAQAQNSINPATFQALMRAIFGVGGAKAMDTLLADIGKVNSKLNALKGAYASTGQAADAAQQRNDTYTGSLNELHTTVDNIAAVIGGPLAANLAIAFRGINNFLSIFTSLPASTVGTIGTFLVMGAAISGVAFVLAALFLVFSSFSGVAAITLGIAAGFGALAVAGTAIKTHWSQIQTLFHGVSGALHMTSTASGGLQTALKNTANALLGGAKAPHAMAKGIEALRSKMMDSGIAAHRMSSSLGTVGEASDTNGGKLKGLGKAADGVGNYFKQIKPLVDNTHTALQGVAIAAGSVAAGFLSIVIINLIGDLIGVAVKAGALAVTLWTSLMPALTAWLIALRASTVGTAIADAYVIAGIPGILAMAGAWLIAGASAMLAALPFIIIGVVIAGMIIGIVLIVAKLGLLKVIMDLLHAAFKAIEPALASAGASIKGAFTSALKELQPVWAQLVQAFNAAKPVLIILGAVLGGILVVAIGIFIGLIVGAIKAIAAFIVGIIGIIKSIIEVIAGIITFFMGFFSLIQGLVTGNTSEIHRAFATMGHGIQMIFSGLWGIVSGIFVTAFNVIKGLIGGFIEGAVAFFSNLPPKVEKPLQSMIHNVEQFFADLGPNVAGAINSMIAKVIGAITTWEASMGTKAGEVVTSFLGKFATFGASLGGLFQTALQKVVTTISGFGATLLNAGMNLMRMLAQGITNGIANVAGAAGGAATKIKNLLGFKSPTKEGPLSDSDTYMPNMMKMYASGILKGIPLLQAATLNAAKALNPSLSSSNAAAQHAQFAAASSAGQGQAPIQIFLDSKDITSGVLNQVGNQAKINGIGRYWK